MKKIKSLYPSRPGRFLDGGTQRRTNTAAPELRCDKYSTEPGSQVFATFKIMQAQGGRSEKFSIRMRNPCNRQLISIHVRIQFFDPGLRRFLTKDGIPLIEEPLRQLGDVIRMVD